MTEPKHPGGILLVIDQVAARDAAVDFAIEWGGEEFYVPTPERLRPGHELMSLGSKIAAVVADKMHGENVTVPHARKWVSLHLFSRGMSASEVAELLNIAKSTARQYRRITGACSSEHPPRNPVD
ncbi:MAG: helix-turn-helix domain containing protein [Gammaproteobacteria bacterium]|nr:helix-turn-helix domain containing protein [Gammaproteobacteria bacterium]